MNQTRNIIIAAVAALLLIIGIPASCHSVPAGHTGVITTFGKVNPETLKEGVNFLNPFSRVHDIDCKEDVFVVDNITFPSQDQLVSTADISVKWRIDSTQVAELYQNTGDRDAIITRHLEPTVRGLIRGSSRTIHTAEEFFNSETQAKIQADLEASMRAQLGPKGIIVSDVILRDVVLPKVIQDAVNMKKQRQQQAEQQQAELARYKTEQQQLVEKANAEKEAATMTAEKIKIEADAKAYQTTAQAKAKAEAIKIESEAMKANPTILIMRAIETWDGVMPKIVGNPGQLLINPESLVK